MPKESGLLRKNNMYTAKRVKPDNSGFTLLEVLIAAIILAIVAIPILHAFVTTANTSAKAKVKMNATNAAENIMEDIKGMSIDDISQKYAGVNPAVPNARGQYYIDGLGSATDETVAYEYTITSSDPSFSKDLNKLLDNGYTATINIDPSYYPNINSVNLASFDTVNGNSSAILSLTPQMEDAVYNEFTDRNKKLEVDYIKADAYEYFRDNLKREIRIDITKNGKTTDKDGEEVDRLVVTATISYYIDADQVVPVGLESKKAYSKKIFDNASTGNKLQSVLIFYPPRYSNAADDGDIMIIHNRDSVVTNLYVVAQDITSNPDEWKEYTGAKKGLNLQIYENEVDGKQPITIFSNLNAGTEYNKTETSKVKPLLCFLKVGKLSQDPEGVKDTFNKKMYNTLKNRKGNFADEDVTKSLHARDVDGKLLDASEVADKIYDVRVTVEKSTSDDEWPMTVTLTGTITQDDKVKE